MPKLPASEINERVMTVLGEQAEAAGINLLLRLLNGGVSRRTLQRRLSSLVAAGRLLTVGEGRAVRYRLLSPNLENKHTRESEKIREDETNEFEIPLSTSAAQVRASVRQPLGLRVPAGYRGKFLDAYRPNKTPYLTPEIIKHLHRIGRTTIAERPAGTYARHILNRLLIDLSWASSRLEGNTYSLLETKRLIESGEAAHGRAATETQMILNHKAAIEFLVDAVSNVSETHQTSAFDARTVRNLHALLSDNLLPDSAASGRLRRIGVGIHGSVYQPLEMPQLIEERFEQIVETAAAIREPFEQSFFSMVHLPYLQPFEDVNKRVSRLAANIPLFEQNLCPLSFIDVPERTYIEGLLGVYELNRIELLRDVFVWAYERSCQRYVAVRQSLGEPDAFRLRFREQLIAVVSDIVRRAAAPTPQEVARTTTAETVPPEHLDHFVRLAVDELHKLHEGNFARFRLRPSEYEAWRKTHDA
ncbi:MAG: Fic family protein [Pyrinomonadaceae bacterium MAG19_C2-C3]|nr:Fic family protein [Pyrinomonadaceae bacterium MAG19_C2-C3]